MESLEVPNPPAFTGRDIDHVGDSNFVGGVRGFAVLDDPADPKPPAEGVLVFADENGNGVRDNLFHVVDPDAFPADTDLLNLYPGVTLSIANTDTSILGFDVLGIQQANGGVTLPNRIFSHSGIPFNNDFRKLRMDFYRPANAVSIEVIAAAGSVPTYGRLDAYDENGVLLGTVVSNPLVFSAQERIGLSFQSDVISYALAYADDDVVDEQGNPLSADAIRAI